MKEPVQLEDAAIEVRGKSLMSFRPKPHEVFVGHGSVLSSVAA
jgi:hypothetical protein